MKTENAHDTTHSKSPANAKRRALLCCSLFGSFRYPSSPSAVPRIRAFRACRGSRGFQTLASLAAALPRRAGAHVRPSRRVSRRLASRLARCRRSKGQSDAPGAEALLSSPRARAGSHDSNRLRRARAETREDDQVIAPRERHRPARPRIVHRRARSVAGCVSRLARPAPSPHRGQISTLELSRVPRKRAAAVTRAPADPLDPCALLSTRAEAVLGSRLTDDAIWPTPSTPAKVRRAPSRSLERHDVSFARERRKTTTHARAKRCALRAKNG